MNNNESNMNQGSVTNFWASLRRGPWGEGVARRVKDALMDLAVHLGGLDSVVAVIVHGSYARGEAGKKSDLDLLILFQEASQLQHQEQETLSLISRAETAARLPVHISPLLASLDGLEELGDDLQQAIASDGIVLHGQLAALARFLPQQPRPAVIITFSLKDAPPATRMRLNRCLHGYAAWRDRNGQRQRVTYPELITPPARSLGPGVLLVPGERRAAVIEALDEAGAVYSETSVWLTS